MNRHFIATNARALPGADAFVCASARMTPGLGAVHQCGFALSGRGRCRVALRRAQPSNL